MRSPFQPFSLLALSFAALPLASVALALDRPVIYSPVGKRDPFKPPAVSGGARGLTTVSPIEKFAVEQLQLRAVLRGLGKARAMFEDPEGRTFIVKEGDLIGRERAAVSRILNSEVIVTERSFNYLGEETLYEKILSLPGEPDIGDTRDSRPASGGGAAARSDSSGSVAPAQESRGVAPAAPAGGSDGGGLTY